MERRHFGVFTQLGNGHVYPALPMCAELVRRGHRVTYATNSHYAQIIAETGAEPVLLKYKHLSDELAEQMRLGGGLAFSDARFKAMFRSWRSHVFTDTAALLPQMQQFYKTNVPDLVLYDHYHVPGRLFARTLDIPAVQLSAHFAYYNGMAMRRNGVYENPDALVEWSLEVDSLYEKYGLFSKGSLWHLEKLNVYFIPKEFQHNFDQFDDRFCFVGSLLNRPFRPAWMNRSNGKPIILISGLSLFHGMKSDASRYFGIFIEALAESPYHCILSLADEDIVQQVPRNFEIIRRVSHLEILPHAALSLCHGGMGSTLEAIYHGMPTIMVPQNEVCDEVAYRAEELGLGIRISKQNLSVQRVREAIDSMLEDIALKGRVTDMRKVFMRSGGAQLAADRIESLLQ